MRRKSKTNRAPARSAYDTYLSWWFRYSRHNEMYSPNGMPFAQPLDATRFQRRYEQMRRANIPNPARQVAMESRVATESQLRGVLSALRSSFTPQQIRERIGKDLKIQDLRKNYSQWFNEFLGDLSHEEKNEIFSPKEQKIA